MTQRHARALDHTKATERAVALGDDAGLRHGQRQAEPFIGRGHRFEPCRWPSQCGRHGDDSDCQGRTLPSVADQSEGSCNEADGGDDTQAVLGWQREHCQHDAERARAGTREIGAIDGTDPYWSGGKTEADGAAGGKERQRQQEIHRS